jgi:hypothetical protein
MLRLLYAVVFLPVAMLLIHGAENILLALSAHGTDLPGEGAGLERMVHGALHENQQLVVSPLITGAL